MRAGAEELQGQGGVAVAGEPVVVEQIGEPRRTVSAGAPLLDEEQGGEVATRVAADGVEAVRRVAEAPVSASPAVRAAGREHCGARAATGPEEFARTPGASALTDRGSGARRTVRPAESVVAARSSFC